MKRLLPFWIGWVAAIHAGLALAAEGRPDSEPERNATPEKYVLAYRFKPAETVRWRVVHQATVRTTMQGTTQTAKTRSESVKVWKVTGVGPEGDIDLVHSVEWVKMVNELPHRAKIQYDSRQDDAPPPGFEGVADTIGVPLTSIRMTPHGKVLQREEKLQQPGNRPDMPITMLLPSVPVAIGHVWNEPYELTIPAGKGTVHKIKTRRRFELMDVAGDVATIAIDYQVLTPMRDPAVEARLAQRLSHSVVKFDIEAGRIVSQQLDVDKRVLGFSGPASSIHHVMRRTERLLGLAEKVARSGR